MRRAIVAALAGLLVLPIGAAAHDEECSRSLWAVPFAEVELPDGWELEGYHLTGPGKAWAWLVGPVVAELYPGEDKHAYVNVELECVPSVTDYYEARAAEREFIGYRGLRVVAIGDANRASRSTTHIR